MSQQVAGSKPSGSLQVAGDGVVLRSDLQYASVDGLPLLLDLYRPDTATPPPVVIYVHGGGWAVGDKADEYAKQRGLDLASHGIAVASINYRLIDQSRYPAQVHDVNAAVRFMRGTATKLEIAAEKIGIWGASAGAHLAALCALTTGDAEMEGALGDHLGKSSAIDCAVSWFGVNNLLLAGSKSALERQLIPTGPEAGLLGVADVSEAPEVARSASPLYRVGADAPPFLIAHGDRDRMVPLAQSTALHDALITAGVASSLVVIGGAGHEDAAFDVPANIAMTAAFLSAHLRA
jgi:acetyl esterase/lipase